MHVYWWRPESKFKNFGDELNGFLLDKMGVTHSWSTAQKAELVIAGSVLQHLPEHYAGTVCGTGKLHEHNRIHLGDARVFALRGKLTQAGVTGLGGQQPVLGDPGLLAPMFVRQPVAKHDLGVVGHWSDEDLHRRFAYGHRIDPTWPVEKVIREIASCRRIVSSSLHGLIIADAYGIPRQAERHGRFEHEGDDFKYRDYASVYDGDVHWGHMWLAPQDVVQQIREDLYNALVIATGIDLSTESRRHPQVSLLVPFKDDGMHRGEVWNWLRQYWRGVYPEAEIIQGHDDGSPFSKSTAVNQAASLARGRTFVVIDADAYLPASVIKGAADRIDQALHDKQRTWFIPYDRLYRLDEDYTKGLLKTSPSTPIPLPPSESDLENTPESQTYGHKFGALCQIMPREAFGLVEGMDPRFRGWGCEDAAFLRSIDTLYGQHEVIPGPIAHLWHATTNTGYNRQWQGQSWSSTNSRLYQRYINATAEPAGMRGLAAEHPLGWVHDRVLTADGDSV